VGHSIPETVTVGPSQHRDHRGKGTRAPSSDVSTAETEDESDEGTDMVAYLNQTCLRLRYEYSKYLS
jgi:hypothetical protein